MEYPVLASSSVLDIPAPVDLWAGSAPIVTNRGVASSAIRQYELVMLSGDGETIYAFNYGTPPSDGSKLVGVAAVAIPNGQSGPYYTSGYFNWEKLVANMGSTGETLTLGLLKSLFSNTPIQVGSILK